VVQALLAQTRAALMLYTDPAYVPTLREQIADVTLQELRCAAPGSDLQLAWTRGFAIHARSDEHLALVQGLLDGTEQFEGLAVDTDMRWHLLQLAIAGRADDAAIDAELARDNTAAGERHAMTVRAARPTAEAKAAAWRS